jgi:hypothetical protein
MKKLPSRPALSGEGGVKIRLLLSPPLSVSGTDGGGGGKETTRLDGAGDGLALGIGTLGDGVGATTGKQGAEQ